jgi:LPXTG-motif cell wall-anchored protein
VVVCHNGHEIVIDDDGAENGHDQHGDLIADTSAAVGETVLGSDEECVKDYPIKIDDKVDEVLEDGETGGGDAEFDDGDDDADSGSNAGGNDKAGDAKGGKAKGSKAKNGTGKNGNPKGSKGDNEQDNGDGPDNSSGDGADNEPGNNSSEGAGTDTGAGTGTGADAGTGTGTGSEESTPGTEPLMPPKPGTSKPVVEVLGEEATRPKPVAPGKDRVNTKNRAPIVILPELRADRPRNEILPAAAAARTGTARPGAMVLPQTGLGDDLGMLAGIGGTMLLVGGMSLTAGRRRSTTQI